MTPSYLSDLLPPFVGELADYPLRNSYDFTIPRTHRNYVKLSFFWNTLYKWNSLPLNIRQSSSLVVFKNLLKSETTYKHNKLYDIYTPGASVHHSRMRMGLSGLNADRKKYNFIDHNFCPLCGLKPEDSIHFLLKCPNFAMQRNTLMGTISNILLRYFPDMNLYPHTRTAFRRLNSILLLGSDTLSFDDNVLVFKAVHAYICDTKRFDIG